MGERSSYGRQVVLCRVGTFYEAWGLDAVLVVHHAALNPMASQAKAGCPIQNLQQTLDRLTGASRSSAPRDLRFLLPCGRCGFSALLLPL